MPDQVTVRSANPEDADALTAVAVRSKAHWGYSPEFMAACSAELAVTDALILSGDTDYFVAGMGDQIIGFHAIERMPTGDWELAALFVDPDHIGTGAGGLLFRHAAGFARHSGATTLVIQGDPHAEGFYKAMGALEIGSRESDSIPGRMLPLYRFNLGTDHGSPCP